MTTTAEKIKSLQEVAEALDCRLDLQQKEIHKIYGQLDELYKKARDAEQPPDPEPLECWVNVDTDGEFGLAHPTKSEAEERINSHDCQRIAVHMREVTPQMLENEKDAARYRKAKELAGAEENFNWWKVWQAPEKWDEMIDKAMEIE